MKQIDPQIVLESSNIGYICRVRKYLGHVICIEVADWLVGMIWNRYMVFPLFTMFQPTEGRLRSSQELSPRDRLRVENDLSLLAKERSRKSMVRGHGVIIRIVSKIHKHFSL